MHHMHYLQVTLKQGKLPPDFQENKPTVHVLSKHSNTKLMEVVSHQ